MLTRKPPEGMVEYLLELTTPYDKSFPLIPGVLRAVCYATAKGIEEEHNLCKTSLWPIYLVTDDFGVVIVLIDHKGVRRRMIITGSSPKIKDIITALGFKFWDGPVKYVDRGAGFLLEEVNR